MNRTQLCTLALATLVPACSSLGTWSIVMVDMRTGEVAAASATCLAGLDLQAMLGAGAPGHYAAMNLLSLEVQNRKLRTK